MQIETHGKLIFRELTKQDTKAVEIFCKSQNYTNNVSLQTMKWDWCPYWCGALINEKIVSIAGAHPLPEISKNAYRLLFRGAQLPGYSLGCGRDMFKTGIQLPHLLPLQIEWVKSINNSPELYISTNINPGAAKSKRMNDVMMPLLAKRGIWHLERTMILYNVPQNVWRINIDRYTEERNKSLNIN